MRSVLKLPAYRSLLVVYVINELAWIVAALALALAVYRRTGSAAGATVYFLCAELVPALLGPPLVGRLQGYPAHRILPALYGLQCAAFLGLAAMASARFVLALLLAVIIVGGTAALVSRALVRALTVAVTTPQGLLREGNALANLGISVCMLGGPAVAGVVVASGGTSTILLANGIVFGLVAVGLWTFRTLPAPAAGGEVQMPRLRAAVREARRRPQLARLLGVQAVAIVVFTISIPVEVVLAESVLHGGARGYGWLLTSWGAGAVLGSILYTRVRRVPSPRLFLLSSAALALGFGVMAGSPSLWLAAVGAAFGGLGNGIEVVVARTALQERVEQVWMAMIMGINEALTQGMPGVGIVLGGVLTALGGARTALWVAAGGGLLIAGAGWRVLRDGEPAPRAGAQPVDFAEV